MAQLQPIRAPPNEPLSQPCPVALRVGLCRHSHFCRATPLLSHPFRTSYLFLLPPNRRRSCQIWKYSEAENGPTRRLLGPMHIACANRPSHALLCHASPHQSPPVFRKRHADRQTDDTRTGKITISPGQKSVFVYVLDRNGKDSTAQMVLVEYRILAHFTRPTGMPSQVSLHAS